jgi:hypothetical protein
MGKRNGRLLSLVKLGHAEKLARQHFDLPLANHGLIGQREYIDNTDYFIVPAAADLELCWYYCNLDGQQPMAALELAVDKDNDAERSCSRLIWTSGKGRNYSMMGAENERHISKRGEELLRAINLLLATDMTVGVEYPIKEDRLAEIVEFHAQSFLTVKGLTK